MRNRLKTLRFAQGDEQRGWLDGNTGRLKTEHPMLAKGGMGPNPATDHLLFRGALVSRFQAGLLASGSSYCPRLPASPNDAVAGEEVVPGHSGATATDLHRLPCRLKAADQFTVNCQ